MTSLIKSKINNNKIILFYYLNIFILLVYSIYKNGYLLYRNNLIGIFDVFRPLTITLFIITTTYLIDYLFKRKKYKNIFLEDYNPIYISLILLALPVNIKLSNLLIITIIFNILNNKMLMN